MSKNVISFIFENAWAITVSALENIITIAERQNTNFDIEKLQKNEGIFRTKGQPLSGNSTVWMRGDVAIIPVIGPIFPRATLFTEVSGAASVQSITSDLREAIRSDAVNSIVLYADSPGGQVTGIQELASLIYENRDTKPIKGYVYGQGASAMYNLLSATSEIVISPTATVGSIGVLTAVQDTREKEKKSGVKTIEFVSSVSPNKTINFDDDSSLAKVQRMVDALGNVMVSNIAKYRGVTSETVLEKYGQGDFFVGQTAVDRGMVERLGTFENLISEMDTSNSFTLTRGGNSMDLETLKSQHPDVYASVVSIGKNEAEASFEPKLVEAKAEGAKLERERIQKIETIRVPGSKNVIDSMKFNPEATKESVALAVIEAQQKNLDSSASATVTDATEVGAQISQIENSQGEGIDTSASDAEEKALNDAMVQGINKN